MEFQFKVQSYQTDAVEAVAQVFRGQEFVPGCVNRALSLSGGQLLENIRRVQAERGLPLSGELSAGLGGCSLDVEMETGTGKTYVYIKTVFELNRRYGWSRFIVVTPSIAIREGVRRSFETTREHFMEHYGKKARVCLYDSQRLHLLEEFARGGGIQVMIINTQAFAASQREGRIIYSERDEFASVPPIDLIGAARPILILDEPQKMGGRATQEALRRFQPLFSLYYSATHARRHDLVYLLDASDAFRRRLVKKIAVKGIEVSAPEGRAGYLFLEGIILSGKRPPAARLELEVRSEADGPIRRSVRTVKRGEDLYRLSGALEQYRGCRVTEIDAIGGRVVFGNGRELTAGEAVGDVLEQDIRRIQIRETIYSHLEKEAALFSRGVKVLSLFFIDKVAKYRRYSPDAPAELGEYGAIFEEEYRAALERVQTDEDTPYQRYLRRFAPEEVHRGYFSVDRRSGRSIDSVVKRGAEGSDDLSAYELILKNKERLLSFEEPARFLFSHSALREGWDNPNVFQICALKRSDSQTGKRQEVGRGLRLCVDQEGRRMDEESCGEDFSVLNTLTVVAEGSYRAFAAGLQQELRPVLREGTGVPVENGRRARIVDNALNANFRSRAFQAAWARLNYRYAYTVEFDSGELIAGAAERLAAELSVAELRYTTRSGAQREAGEAFEDAGSRSGALGSGYSDRMEYDLVGKTAAGAGVTRRTAAEILCRLPPEKLGLFGRNPEAFLSRTAGIIREVRAALAMEHIAYQEIEGGYDPAVLAAERGEVSRACRGRKHVREFLFLPSEGAEAVRRFARGLDEAEEVRAYARLSKDFCIPTPVGAYTPEWFVAFQDGGCCLVETRGTDARAVCAERLYAGRVPFWFAADCEELLHALNKNH